MNREKKTPRFVVHVVPEAGGFRPVVALKCEFVYRGDVCIDLAAARRAASQFVVGHPDLERAMVWAIDLPFWIGSEEVGRISVEPFPPRGCCSTGWVRPPRPTAFAALMAEGLEYSRRWATGPDRDAASDLCLKNGIALAELGLAVGCPPQSVESLNVMGDWHMFFCLNEAWVPAAEPDAA